MKLINLSGQRFGRLVVLKQDVRHNNRTHWIARCDCGIETSCSAERLKLHKTKSCGCLNLELIRERGKTNATHGHTRGWPKKSRTYMSWDAMKQRCLNPRTKSYPHYGGRGIGVCDRWLNFENFLADVGERPAGKTLDRYPDPNGNYCPENVRWATPKEQRLNTRVTGVASNGSLHHPSHIDQFTQ